MKYSDENHAELSWVREHELRTAAGGANSLRYQLLQEELQSALSRVNALSRKANALVAENNRLRSQLASLRRSRTMRMGKAMGAPARALISTSKALRRLGSQADPAGLARLRRSAADAIERLSARTQAGGAETHHAALNTPAGSAQERLLVELQAHPGKDRLLKLVRHAYYELGMITYPVEVLAEYAELLTDLDSREQFLVESLQSFGRLLDQPPVIPTRQATIAYTAEPGRVMYCAHSSTPYNTNGYSTRTTGLTAGIHHNDTDVYVVARPGYPWDSRTDVEAPTVGRHEEEHDGVPYVFNQGPSWTTEGLVSYIHRAADAYVREAIRLRPAMIHAASNHVTALPALIAARRLGVPFVYEVRGLWEITELSGKDNWAGTEKYHLAVTLENLVAGEADAVLAITSQVRDELVRRGVDARRISVVPNAVDTEEFAPLPEDTQTREHLNIPAGVPVIGYAGSLVEYEGLGLLIQAVAGLLDGGTDVRLVIVGDGKSLAGLQSQAARLGVADRVIFPGRIPADEVPRYISIFDIMPCPRLPLPVTEMVSPLKPLEAMAAAKAVVLSDLAPLRDLAGEGEERALLFRAGDADDLARVLQDLVSDKDRRLELGRRARAWTLAERTWDIVARTAVAAYDDARRVHASHAVEGRSLHSVTLGIISDRFTMDGLADEVNLVALRPDTWQEQLEAQSIDALFVESAWSGIDGLWKQKVGYYDDEQFSTLREILEHCRAAGIPTIFWNKEDPVHFNRFSRTASHFEHVFTTDAGSIPNYLASAGPRLKTIGALPFYAQPRLHNPLPGTREFSHTVAFAGSYYGDRYKDRSDQLRVLLESAEASGLTIYDRQHSDPNSPYRFPPHLARFVRGGLSYSEMVQAYKAHPVHLNVNSVTESPTMFSRRVVEIAAAGGVVVSGPGEGMANVMTNLVYTVDNELTAEPLIEYLMNNEAARKADAWLAMRAVFRAHTAAHRLTLALRMAGLDVVAPVLDRYAVLVDRLTPAALKMLETQSVPPACVVTLAPVGDAIHTSLPVRVHSPETFEALAADGVRWAGRIPEGGMDRTYFEDLLTTSFYGQWTRLAYSSAQQEVRGSGLAASAQAEPGAIGLVDLSLVPAGGGKPEEGVAAILGLDGDQPLASLVLHREIAAGREEAGAASVEIPDERRRCVLVAGHDLKFAQGIISRLEHEGHEVLIDQWKGHAQHDAEQSAELLAKADVVFCEWGLGNAVWYSGNVRPHQRLVTRVHSQEIFTSYLKEVNTEAVDRFIFVGPHIADVARRDAGIPAERTLVIPNPVDVAALDLPKAEQARFTLGLVGIVPAQKGLSRALDVLAMLRRRDDRYTLRIKGKRPEDYPWMAKRTEEMAYYQKQYDRIENDPDLAGAVTFDPHGNDMPQWYSQVGVVLSVSEFESFHLTLADGAASGALPASLAWPGSDRIYPVDWLSPGVADLADRIFSKTQDTGAWSEHAARARDYVRHEFDSTSVLGRIVRVILDGREVH